MERSPEKNPNPLKDIFALAVVIQSMRSFYPTLMELYPHKYSSEEDLLEIEREFRVITREKVREAKEKGISPKLIAITFLKGRIIGEIGVRDTEVKMLPPELRKIAVDLLRVKLHKKP